MRFGDLWVRVPSPPEQVLTRHFGADWNEIAYRTYDHTKEESLTPFMVQLTDEDRKPALPYKPLEKKGCHGITGLNKKHARIANEFSAIRPISPDCSQDRECLTDGIPTYVINCEFSSSRLETFEKDAKREQLSVCREPCVDGRKFDVETLLQMKRGGVVLSKSELTPIEFAIFLSHYNCWARILESCEPYGIVMEDDLRLKKGFRTKLQSLITELKEKSIDFDILYLWDGNWAQTKKRNVGVQGVFQHIGGYNAGGVAYLLSRRLAKILVNNAFPVVDPVDIYIGDYFDKGIIALALTTKYKKGTEIMASPLIEVQMGGLEGTGDTTQDYKMTQIGKKKVKRKL